MGLSFMHLLIIVVILLLIFGPSRLPSLGKSVGEAIRGFKSGLEGTGDIDVTPKKQDQITQNQQNQQNTQTTTNTDKNKS